MVGISSIGAYLPIWRLDRQVIAKEWSMGGAAGEKAVANFDEDSITMAVAAATDCLGNRDRHGVDSLLFATTTSPYREKQAATIVAAGVDLRDSILTTDYANSLRAGTTALQAALDAVKAGSSKSVLVVAADCRTGGPRSEYEMALGDGAAAVLVEAQGEIARVLGQYHVAQESMDTWRSGDQNFVGSWEDRWVITEGLMKASRQAATECLKACGLATKDVTKAILYAPDSRRHAELARALGLDAKTQVADGLFDKVGCTGAAHALLLLAAALEQAKPGDKLLLVNYGDGADAYVLEVTPQISQYKARRAVSKHLSPKRMVPDYPTYAQWKGIVSAEAAARRPPRPTPSPPALWRDREQVLHFYGARCKSCGYVQYPPQRVCTRCHAKDQQEKLRLSDKKAAIFTYSMDYIGGTMDIPLVITVIDFEGGGRALLTMTDRDIRDVKIGMPVELSFRKLFTAGGIHNYYWKTIPVRS